MYVAGFAQSLNNVEQAVRYHTNIIVTALNQSISSTAIEYVAVADTRSNSQLEELGSKYGWCRFNSQLEELGSKYGWARSNSQLEELGSKYGWARSNSQLEELGSKYGWARSNSQLEDLGSKYGWADLILSLKN